MCFVASGIVLCHNGIASTPEARGALHFIENINVARTEDPETGAVTTRIQVQLYDKLKALETIRRFHEGHKGTGRREGTTTAQEWIKKINSHTHANEDGDGASRPLPEFDSERP